MIAVAKPMSRASRSPVAKSHEPADQQDLFLGLLPTIHRHAMARFRRLDSEAHEDAVAAVVAHAWELFVRLANSGRQELAFAAPLARFGVARTLDGRQVGNPANGHDVTSRWCQRRQGVRVRPLDQRDPATGEWQEILLEDRKSTPADIACTRIDFQAWFRSLPRRHRRIARLLAHGEQTRVVAQMFRLTAGRVSQIRANSSGPGVGSRVNRTPAGLRARQAGNAVEWKIRNCATGQRGTAQAARAPGVSLPLAWEIGWRFLPQGATTKW